MIDCCDVLSISLRFIIHIQSDVNEILLVQEDRKAGRCNVCRQVEVITAEQAQLSISLPLDNCRVAQSSLIQT